MIVRNVDLISFFLPGNKYFLQGMPKIINTVWRSLYFLLSSHLRSIDAKNTLTDKKSSWFIVFKYNNITLPQQKRICNLWCFKIFHWLPNLKDYGNQKYLLLYQEFFAWKFTNVFHVVLWTPWNGIKNFLYVHFISLQLFKRFSKEYMNQNSMRTPL